MNYKPLLFSFIAALFAVQPSLAQYNVVNVDALTGSAALSIPLYTIQNGAVSTAVNLVYNGNGVRVKDVENNAGMGWQVSGGGQITRELRGLPDDSKKDNSGNNRLGWIYNTNGSKINSLTIVNNGTANCTNEATDITNLTNNFADLSDTEPDVFSVDAPGLSCRFVFDNNHNIKTIPYQDVQISYTSNATTGAIMAFTVINDKGVKYTFTDVTNAVRQTTNTVGSGATQQTVNESNIAYFKNRYTQFRYGINYISSWSLTQMTDPSNNSISFSYTSGLVQNALTPFELYIGNTTKTVQYWTQDFSTPLTLSGISGGTGNVAFTYANNYRTAVPMVNVVSANGIQYLLNYSSVTSTGTNYYRYFLRDVTTDQCNSNFKYHFSYYGESYSSNQYLTTLSDSTSKGIDYWGYQNSYANTDLSPSVNINPATSGYQRYQVKTDNVSRTAYTYSVSGADRRANPAVVMAGALTQITYFNNGTTTLTYESNDYYDPTGNLTVQGGGIRVKQVTVYDGLNTANNIVHNYTYLNTVTGLSSGKPTTLPVYAFTRPYTGTGSTADLWNAATVRSELDLSADDHTINYSQVTMSQTGAGKTLYEYYLPAMNYDMSAVPSCNGCATADWSPNVTNIARPGCVASGFATNDFDTYPFTPNLNYDFERGLIKKITNYNDAGAEVSESNYTYQRTGTPGITTALKFEDNATVKAYLKYQLYTSAGELSLQVTNKVFDLNSTTLSQQNSVNYFYNSALHRLPTQTQTTKSDGTVENSYIRYSKDYVTTTRNDSTVIALYNLQLQNINIPVESYTQTVKGGVTKTTTAQLVKYKPFVFTGYSLYLPVQKLQFFDQNGVASFTPSAVSSGLFTSDSKYVVAENDRMYDETGFLQTSDDNRKHVRTALSDSYKHFPLAVVSNAAANEIAYYNYASAVSRAQFVPVGTLSSPAAGRTVQSTFALSFPAGGSFTKSIVKNINTKNYIFSAWINAGTAGNINLILTGSDNLPHSYPMAFAASSGVWKYYELKVPVAALSPVFTTAFTNAASTSISIDDVLFYPENAEIISYDYDRTSNAKIAETNTTGVAHYYVYDAIGRLNLIYDQDKQIVGRRSYSYLDSNGAFTDPAFSTDLGSSYANSLITFSPYTNYNPCQFTGITYTWNFGDGSSPVTVTSNTSQTHVYANPGMYTVTETVNAPGYGTKSTAYTFTLSAPPPPDVPVSYVNNSAAGAVTTVTFSQAGIVKYTLTAASLQAGTAKVLHGTYYVTVHCGGTLGSVKVDSGLQSFCANYFRTNSYSFNVNIGSQTYITLNDTACN